MTSRQPKRDAYLTGRNALSRQPLAVAADSFAEFDLWLSIELERLVDRWAHVAAPNAATLERVARWREV